MKDNFTFFRIFRVHYHLVLWSFISFLSSNEPLLFLHYIFHVYFSLFVYCYIDASRYIDRFAIFFWDRVIQKRSYIQIVLSWFLDWLISCKVKRKKKRKQFDWNIFSFVKNFHKLHDDIRLIKLYDK